MLTAEQQKVHFVINFEFFYLWGGDDYLGVATELLSFGFDVSKGSGDGEAARENAEGPVYDVGVLLAGSLVSLQQHRAIVLARLISNSLD